MSEKAKLVHRSLSGGNSYGTIKYEPLEPQPIRTHFTKRDCVIVLIVVTIAVVAIVVTLSLGLPRIKEKRALYLNTSFPSSQSPLHKFQSTAVLADAEPCAPIGRNILDKGGSAVDAAIATLLCNGAANPQSMGLGGGVFITIYIKSLGVAEVIDGRESAPANATVDMFNGNSSLSQLGGLAVAVPGELKAYWTAHEKYGKLNWSDLVMPTVRLCQDGFKISRHMASRIEMKRDKILKEPSMKQLLYNNETNDLYKEGEILRRPVLAETLLQIAQKGVNALYEGELAKKLVNDLNSFGSIITLDDLKNYKAKVKPATKSVLSTGDTFYSVPPPGSGAVLSLILNIMDGYNMNASIKENLKDEALMYHRLIEAFKFSFAKRTYLGDEDFVNVTEIVQNLTSKHYADLLRKNISDEKTHVPSYYGPLTYTVNDHGTAQVSVITENGDAVSATGTINSYFGALIRSTSTDIILNNDMDDFSAPNITNQFGLTPSEANFIQPGKRPLSSMCPGILVDPSGDVRFVIGGAGGTRITTGSALVMYRNLFLGEDIKVAVDALRLHHQLSPNKVFHEKGFPRVLLDRLKSLGHQVHPEVKASAIQGIVRSDDGQVFGNLDYRKGGSLVGY